MEHNLHFSFEVDKASNSIHIVREFAAGLPLVWDAFTQPEILDQWGAPAPWTIHTKFMDFRAGGRRLYAMRSPEGQEHWSIQDYTSITPKTNLQYLSGFADKDGNTHPEFSGSKNNLDFSEADGITTVRISIEYKTAAILQMMVEKGFREGFTATMVNLEKLLNSLVAK
jgi:uncharacterized protein YndB with AHSA1/START domain